MGAPDASLERFVNVMGSVAPGAALEMATAGIGGKAGSGAARALGAGAITRFRTRPSEL